MTTEPDMPGHHSITSASLSDTLRWAFELDQSPALAGATWITREIIPAARDPFEAILASSTSLDALRELKNAYKMLRTSGTTAPERSLAARLYAATIAAALVRHHASISTQTPAALQRAFTDLAEDESMPERLREVATLALGIHGRG
ncbi:MAG: hypothetical protein GC172_09850 [Phycisphaera sp.]|nr:hypothetical protein [Phycisphaera sp.]